MPRHDSQSAYDGSFYVTSPSIFIVRRLTAALLGLVVAVLLVATPASASEIQIASHADAFVTHNDDAGIWTIGSSTIAVSFGFGPGQQLVMTQVTSGPTRERRAMTPGPDTMIALNGQLTTLAVGTTGLSFAGVAAETLQGGVHLAFEYTHDALHARVVRHYACYPGSPTIETWTRVEVAPGAAAVTVSQLTGWQLTLPLGTVRWINGLRGDAPDTPVDDAFSLGYKDLAPDEQVTLSARERSSERFVPFIMIDRPNSEWYGGVQWSGAWQITSLRQDTSLRVTLSYPDLTTRVSADRPLKVPHSFFGVTTGGPTEVSGALRTFITTAIRKGRPFQPLVTYNTWFVYGSRIDEPTMMNEINQTASIGIELFVLDAGWYPGAGTDGSADFDTGLGTWRADPDRFPNGLRPLADFAHASGMKFGLWVEPGRVDLATVGRPGLADSEWLATRDGRNVSATSAQICYYASRAARQWVLEQITRLLDEVQPDYLKWDNNMWLNCNRAGHDHGPEDGNFAQVQGLYEILQAVRDRYPDLLIENVSDGGSRIDFGWLQYSDTAWMDDRTQPSAHVRHNLEGLSMVFPPAYFLSFVIDDPNEPFINAPDLPGAVRSRMPGILGLTYRSPGMRPSIRGPLAQAIKDYRSFRDILINADAIRLSDPAESPTDLGWDALEELDAQSGEAVIFAFQHLGADDRYLLHPRGLNSEAMYDVRSLDAGALGSMRGDQLMANGIEIVQGDGSQGHVLVLRIQ